MNSEMTDYKTPEDNLKSLSSVISADNWNISLLFRYCICLSLGASRFITFLMQNKLY